MAEEDTCIISPFKLKFVLWPSMWSVLENVLFILEENVDSVVL